MYDFAIIGSGVSGGSIAFDLVAGGAKCVLIEAGKAFDRHSFPEDEMGYSTRMYWGGGMEISRDARFAFLRGKCLGGTSVLNQALLRRLDDLAWDSWRERSGIEFFASDAIEPFYNEVLAHIAAEPIPQEYRNRNADLLVQAFQQKGLQWEPILRAQSDCRWDRGSDCMVCLGGCPRDAKQSTLVRGIPEAKAEGLVVETEWEAIELVHANDRVQVVGRCHGAKQVLEAAKVVLAAGTFGNTTLLLRSPEIAKRLPALGTAFCCHPQFVNFGLHDEPVDAHKGAFSAVESHDEKLRHWGIKLENVAAPPIPAALLIPGWGPPHHARMRKYRHLACLEFAICDEPVGRLRLDRRKELVRHKRLTDQDRARIGRGRQLAVELLEAAGATQVIPCEMAFGLHLMGGCPIGTDPMTSVVGPDFRVHGHQNLFAADSSIFPTAPGINPSFTIMALSRMASHSMLER